MIKDIIIHILRRPSMPNNLALELVTHRNTRISGKTPGFRSVATRTPKP